MEYWQKDIETMNRKDLEKLQLERLKKTIEAAGNSPFYKKVLAENGITADSIGRFAEDPFHDERRPPQQLSVRHGGYPYPEMRTHPLVERHDRQPYGRVAFGQGPGPMG